MRLFLVAHDGLGDAALVHGGTLTLQERRLAMKRNSHQQRVRPIFVSSEREHSYKGTGDYRYHIWYNGSLEIPSVTADELREMITCMKQALVDTGNEKGGEK